jgi:hypothetical protein
MQFHDLHAITYYLHTIYIKYIWLFTYSLHPRCKIMVITKKIQSNYDCREVPPILEMGGTSFTWEKPCNYPSVTSRMQ